MENNIPFTEENFQKLLKVNNEMEHALKHVIDSCVHPDIAHRAVMVELAPIRKALRKNAELFGA